MVGFFGSGTRRGDKDLCNDMGDLGEMGGERDFLGVMGDELSLGYSSDFILSGFSTLIGSCN